MQGNTAIKRLSKEFKLYQKSLEEQLAPNGIFVDNFILKPDKENLQKWYFVIFGLGDAFKNGVYIGRIEFPDGFPAMAPDVLFLQDTGRFKTLDKICLSITSHH